MTEGPIFGSRSPNCRRPWRRRGSLERPKRIQKPTRLKKRDEWRPAEGAGAVETGRPASVSASKLASIAKEEPDPEEPWKRGRAGTSIGSAVHGVLQTIDLARGDGIEDQSRSQATAESVPERWAEVAGLVRNAINSEGRQAGSVVQGKLWREVPVGCSSR